MLSARSHSSSSRGGGSRMLSARGSSSIMFSARGSSKGAEKQRSSAHDMIAVSALVGAGVRGRGGRGGAKKGLGEGGVLVSGLMEDAQEDGDRRALLP